MVRPTAEDRQTFVDFAEFLSLGSGVRLLRVLEMLVAEATRERAPTDGRARQKRSPVDSPSPSSMVGTTQAGVAVLDKDHPELRGRSDIHLRRLVLLGESAAAGYLLAPNLTPAKALREVLVSHSPDPWEVVDLAAVDLSGTDLLAAARRAAELRPDVVVIFAGNNWPVRLRLAPPPGHLGPVEQALAFRAEGVAGLRRLADDATRRVARQTLSGVLRLVRVSGAEPVVVVPEVDLWGWSRARPPAWLPGNGITLWHDAHATARRCLHSRDPEGALGAAEGMIALDGGHCATTHRLRATALRALGRRTEAREAARDEVNARAWDNEPTVPGVTSLVQNALRSCAAEHGALVVDLPALFEGEPDDSPLFLDYCHLSPRGIAVAVAALAQRTLAHAGLPAEDSALRTTAEAVCRLSPASMARAHFLAGLYTAHWSEPAGGEADAARARLAAALAADPSFLGAFFDWVSTRVAPREATLFSLPMQRLGDGLLAGLDPLWNVPGLDPDGLVRLTDVGGADLATALVHGLVGSAHDASRCAVNLLDPAYIWNAPAERAAHRTFGCGTHAFRRVFWPSLDVALVADGQRSVTLELTLRHPGLASAGGKVVDSGGEKKPSGGDTSEDRDVAIYLNDRPITSVRIGTTWRREKVTFQAAALEPGLNRLRLTFPLPAPDADAALARIGEGLDLGIGAEIHPCFGEVFRLVARPATER